MTRPGFANQQHLLGWADTASARGELPRLIRRLILETGTGVHGLDFPADEGTAVGGWDGIARASGSSPFVPAGLSLWELSVGRRSTNRKADADYEKRLSTPDGSPTAEASYRAVALRRWADRRKWSAAKTRDRRWRDVGAYGIDDLEAWLETGPVTHAWISERIGLKPYGMQTADAWWSAWQARPSPLCQPPSCSPAARKR